MHNKKKLIHQCISVNRKQLSPFSESLSNSNIVRGDYFVWEDNWLIYYVKFVGIFVMTTGMLNTYRIV